MLEPQSPVLPDATLLERLVQRDSTALVELERRHHGSLYAQVYGMLMDATLAEQVVRDTFVQLWHAAGRFVGTRSASSWLRDMARELARAEVALRDPQYSTSVRRTDDADPDTRYGGGAAVYTRGADAGAELPRVGDREDEGGSGDGSPRDACAW